MGTLNLSLNGVFSLSADSGETLFVKGPFNRAVLAFIATGRDMCRSREYMSSILWPRAYDATYARNSLRQSLAGLRRDLGPYAQCLEADRSTVQLRDLTLEPKRHGIVIFEDAPKIGEEFEDWLRLERSSAELDARCNTGGSAVAPARVPTIALRSPIVMSSHGDSELLAMILLDHIAFGFRHSGMLDVLDMRDLDSVFSSSIPNDAEPSAMVVLRLFRSAAHLRISVDLQDMRTRRVLWSTVRDSTSIDQNSKSDDSVMEFASHIVEGMTEAILSNPTFNTASGDRPTMYRAAHTILALSHAEQSVARANLANRLDLGSNAVAAAWHTFSYANTYGESDGDGAKTLIEVVDEGSRRAIALDRSNPVVLILMAHARGFVLRDLETAAELAAQARKLGPQFPLVWDLSAMNALYRNRPEEAYAHAKRAQSIGQFSPYRQFYSASHAITAAVTGRHAEAVSVGERVLAELPGYLAVKRHHAASLAALGRTKDAWSVVSDIRRSDAKFTNKLVRTPGYPLVADASRSLIGSMFTSLGACAPY